MDADLLTPSPPAAASTPLAPVDSQPVSVVATPIIDSPVAAAPVLEPVSASPATLEIPASVQLKNDVATDLEGTVSPSSCIFHESLLMVSLPHLSDVPLFHDQRLCLAVDDATDAETSPAAVDFTNYLDQVVAQTKKTIAENVTSPKHEVPHEGESFHLAFVTFTFAVGGKGF